MWVGNCGGISELYIFDEELKSKKVVARGWRVAGAGVRCH